MPHRPIIVAGGLCFIVGALAFVAVFGYLAAKFSYPDILDGAAAEVLPRLRAGGPVMRAIWAVYGCLLLLLIPGAVGAFFACPSSRGRMTLALVAASLGALIGAFRNVAPSVQPGADVNNALLPLWMIVLGVSLIWTSGRSLATRSRATP